MVEPIDPGRDDHDGDRDALAGELALGVLTGDERAQALRLSLSDPAFAAAVEAWRDRLAPLHDDFAEASAPDLWPTIERRLGTGTGSADAATARNVRFWRWMTAGSGAIAASLAAALVLFRPAPVTIEREVVREVVRAPDETAIARLDGGDGVLLAANFVPAQGDLRVRAIAIPDRSRLAPELWVIPADGVPRSLGLIDARGVTKVTVPANLRALLIDGATLAVTMEAPDGAPHQAPSSTPIATGTISRI